jgi:hypothetical protein
MKVKSFGCSFTYGSDLEDCLYPMRASKLVWPALLAEHFDLDYECHAQPGIGNLRIMNSVIEHSYYNDPAVFIINWTWLDRFDYINPVDEIFTTLRPNENNLENQLYYRHFYNQFHTMLTSASYIVSTIKILESKGITFLMTAQDTILTEPVDQTWQDPRAITALQKTLKPYINWFDDMSFLEWSRKNGFPESDTWHPLEQAHRAAANLMIKVFDIQKTGDLARQAHV